MHSGAAFACLKFLCCTRAPQLWHFTVAKCKLPQQCVPCRARLRCWGIASALLCEVGYALHLTGVVPINKNLCAGRLVLPSVTSIAAWPAAVHH